MWVRLILGVLFLSIKQNVKMIFVKSKRKFKSCFVIKSLWMKFEKFLIEIIILMVTVCVT